MPVLLICVLAAAPVLAANKFELIGEGISGSSSLKREHLQYLLYAIGGVTLLLGLLSAVTPHKNAAFMNFANWKQSAALFSLIGLLAIGAGAFLV